MTDDRDRAVRELLDRHTPAGAETSDWARVVRAAEARPSSVPPWMRRLRWMPAAALTLGVVALVAALIIATPDGTRDGGPGTSTAEAAAPVTVRAYLRDDATDAETARFRDALETLRVEGRIVSFIFRSKEAALEELRSRLKDPSILDELPSNPLPAGFDIVIAPGSDAEGVGASVSAEPALDPRLGIRAISGAGGG